MNRMSIASATAALFAAVFLIAGCSEKYERQDLTGDSVQGRQLRAMIDELRLACGTEKFDTVVKGQIASGLNRSQTEALKATLSRVARAGAVEIVALDRFGQNVYRTTLLLSGGGRKVELCMLIVSRDGKFYWAGRN